MDYAHTMNDAAGNAGRNPMFTDEELEWIGMNLENPGSAPTLIPKADSLSWDHSAGGLGGSAATVWKDFLFKDWASRQKHSLSLSGGDEKLNFYVSGNFYDEGGLTTVGNEKYQRYTFDAKINSKATDWLTLSLLTKFNKTEDDYPWDFQYGRGRMFDLLSKIKPTLPTVDPIFGEPLVDAWYPKWATQREVRENNQILLLPRVIIEPVKDWLINLEYNYRRNNNFRQYSALQYEYKRPNGDPASTPTREQTQVRSNLYTNEYFSPNLYTSYTKSIGGHNFKILAGYQSELYENFNMTSKALHILTDNVPSISTAVGEQTVDDQIGHSATQSLFSRLNYNYKDKYLLEVSYRRDGSSKFEPGSEWAGFPSFSAGYNVANEDFWPLPDHVNVFKLRGSYGTLGNQNVANYLYVPRMGIGSGNYLFNGQWSYIANPPSLTSVDLTWEKVKTIDVGVDVAALGDRFSLNVDWYRTDITDMAAQGEKLPAVLGTGAPLTNIGVTRVQGWEIESRWKESIGDFSYNVGLVLSDYKRSIVEYPNPTNLLSQHYAGKDLGEIWGLEWDGWFQTPEEVTDYTIDQSYVRGGTWTPGDTKYVDQNGDGVIDRGTNTLDDHGDFKVVGNSTPRYQYGVTLGANWKGIDFSMFIQGVGKRDVNIQNATFRGPAIGPFHSNVMEEHLDYWRDDTSPLGANPDAYFPKPYSQNPGNNNRNYRFVVDHYIQDASYMRVKSMQIGYTLPREIVNKVLMDRVRIFVAGENLFTKTDLMLYDPEAMSGSWGVGKAYPLSRVISTGLNITF